MIPAGVAFLVAVALAPLLVRFAIGRNLLDVPNPRSSHEIPTPRLGGVAIIFGTWAGVALLRPEEGWTLLVAVTLAGMIGLADDVLDLHFGLKAAGQAALAVGLLLLVPPPLVEAAGPLGPLVLAVAVFWVLSLVNAFNFMDGIDGISGGTALVNALFLGALVPVMGQTLPVFAGAVLGFLAWNISPARIFLGDSGSYFVGFLLGGAALYVEVEPLPLGGLAAAVVFTPYLFDTAFTILRRLRSGSGKSIFLAHREHIYQRITPAPTFHRQVSILYSGLAVIAGIAALLLSRGGGLAFPGGALFVACCITIVLLPRIMPESGRENGHESGN
jgi:UDP-N-acetylmuramyl pentapeptide phosphotransferase/UDP-N-acetylglucosamine-1-phosphate transferase